MKKKWLLLLVVCLILLPTVCFAEYVMPDGEEIVDCGDFTLTLQAGDGYRKWEKDQHGEFCYIFPAFDNTRAVHTSISVERFEDNIEEQMDEEVLRGITSLTVMKTKLAYAEDGIDVSFLSVEPMHLTEQFGKPCYRLSFTVVLNGKDEASAAFCETECDIITLMVPANEQGHYVIGYGIFDGEGREDCERILSTLCWKEAEPNAIDDLVEANQ